MTAIGRVIGMALSRSWTSQTLSRPTVKKGDLGLAIPKRDYAPGAKSSQWRLPDPPKPDMCVAFRANAGTEQGVAPTLWPCQPKASHPSPYPRAATLAGSSASSDSSLASLASARAASVAADAAATHALALALVLAFLPPSHHHTFLFSLLHLTVVVVS